VYNNRIFDSARGIVVTASNVNISNNIINWTDVGIRISKSVNNTIEFNYVDNTLRGRHDGYMAGIVAEYFSNDSIIRNNIVNNYGSAGIYVRQSKNIQIFNNTLNQASDILKASLNESRMDAYVPTFAIGVLELFKEWVGDGTENRLTQNFTGYILKYNSSDINIQDNVFGTNVQTYLYIEGNYNITHDLDLSTYWFRKFNPMPILHDTVYMYNSNSFDKLTIVHDSSDIVDYFLWGYNTGQRYFNAYINMTISKTSINIANIDQLCSYCGTGIWEHYAQMYNLSAYNWAYTPEIYSALSFSPFNDVFNVSSGVVLFSNVDNLSITLASGEQIIIGDFVGGIVESRACRVATTGMITAFTELPSWYSIMFIVVIVGIVFSVLFGMQYNRETEFDMEPIFPALVAILISGIILAIAIEIGRLESVGESIMEHIFVFFAIIVIIFMFYTFFFLCKFYCYHGFDNSIKY
jgi:parallel beta-helix repeat protein